MKRAMVVGTLALSLCLLLAWAADAGQRKFGHSYGGRIAYYEQHEVRWEGAPSHPVIWPHVPGGGQVIIIAPGGGQVVSPAGPASKGFVHHRHIIRY